MNIANINNSFGCLSLEDFNNSIAFSSIDSLMLLHDPLENKINAASREY